MNKPVPQYTYAEKMNELRLDISNPQNKGKCYIFLEGDSDVRLFRKIFNLENCKVERIPGAKGKLEEAVNILSVIYGMVFGIRDADFLNLKNGNVATNNLFLTDKHDAEMMMVAVDEIVSSILFEFTKVPPGKHARVRMDILRSISFIGYLRWYNEVNNDELNFSSVGFGDVIDMNTFQLNEQQYLAKLVLQSPRAKQRDVNIIAAEVSRLTNSSYDLFQLCNGHDFMKALSIYLNQNSAQKSLNEASVATIFRTSYTFEHFKQTKLFQLTRDWADRMGGTIF